MVTVGERDLRFQHHHSGVGYVSEQLKIGFHIFRNLCETVSVVVGTAECSRSQACKRHKHHFWWSSHLRTQAAADDASENWKSERRRWERILWLRLSSVSGKISGKRFLGRQFDRNESIINAEESAISKLSFWLKSPLTIPQNLRNFERGEIKKIQ